MEMMLDGRVKVESLITHQFKLAEYRKMIEVNLNKGRYKAMKTVVAF